MNFTIDQKKQIRIKDMREKGMTLQKIGDEVGLSKERVRIILDRADCFIRDSRTMGDYARLGCRVTNALRSAGHKDYISIRNLSFNDLLQIRNIGPEIANRILGVTNASSD